MATIVRVLITSANTYKLKREREDKKAMTTTETEETLLLLHLLSFLHMLSITIVVIFSIYFHIRQVWKDRKIDRDDGEFCENSDAIIEKGGPCELLLNEVLFFICPFIQLFTQIMTWKILGSSLGLFLSSKLLADKF